MPSTSRIEYGSNTKSLALEDNERTKANELMREVLAITEGLLGRIRRGQTPASMSPEVPRGEPHHDLFVQLIDFRRTWRVLGDPSSKSEFAAAADFSRGFL